MPSLRDLVILGSSCLQPTLQRNHGAYLIRWRGEGLLFDPGDGTQRQLLFAHIAPSSLTRIFISHFHGDHCLGLGAILMRLNIDKVHHPIHCYFPASGKLFFDRLRFGCVYSDSLNLIEHPISEEGVIHEDANFCIEAAFLDHRIESIGWRITEPDHRCFNGEALKRYHIAGPLVRQIKEAGFLEIDGQRIDLNEVSSIRSGDSVAVVMDTLPCRSAVHLARRARLLLSESTYLEEHRELAAAYCHLTAKQAARMALEAEAELLVLTHFSARYPNAQPLVEEARSLFPNVIAAEDLKIIPFPSL